MAKKNKKNEPKLKYKIMSTLTSSLKTPIAKYLNISKRLIKEMTIMTAVPYSNHAIEVIEETLQSQGLIGVTQIEYNKLEDNSDSIIVCKCLLNDNRCFISLIFDPEELYQSSGVLKLIQV